VERSIVDLPAHEYFEVLHSIQLAYAAGDISGAAEIVANLGLLWELTGRFHDALRCLNQIRPHLNELQPILQGRFLYASACVAHAMANHAVTEEDAARAVEIFRTHEERLWTAHAQRLVATALHTRGDADAAEPLYLESLETFRRAHHVRGERAALINLGVIALDWRCDYERARGFFEEALATRMPDWYTSAIAHLNLSEALYRTGHVTRAVEQARCAREAMPSSGSLLYGVACTALGEYLVASGDVRESCGVLREAVAIEALQQNPKYFANVLESVASLCIATNKYSGAAFLLAYVERYRAEHAVEPTKASEDKRLAMSAEAAQAPDEEFQCARAQAAGLAEIVSECEMLLSTVSTGTHRAVQTQTC
jgi:tetratricopeptide (TPR) repeat protein